MRSLHRIPWFGLACATCLGLVACSRADRVPGIDSVSDAVARMHEGTAIVQNGVAAWDRGDPLQGVAWIREGTHLLRTGDRQLQSGLRRIRDADSGDACVAMIDAGSTGLVGSLKDLSKGHALLVDDSPWNDPRGLGLVKLGLHEADAQVATLDGGVKGYGLARADTTPPAGSGPVLMAADHGAAHGPCAAYGKPGA